MNFHGDTGNLDSDKFIAYIVTQFPAELKQLVEAKDELAKRQGAMSAVDAANADREKAAEELAKAKSEAASLLADAKEKNSAATAKTKDLKAREDALNSLTVQKESDFAAQTEVLVLREAKISNTETALIEFQNQLDTRAMKLTEDEASLQSRVKAFQDKVAALSA
jgi:chromosome segregation ATPase